MKIVLALAEGQIIINTIQKIYWEKDGQDISGNIFQINSWTVKTPEF